MRLLYPLTVFLGAFLLFQVQPVIGKYILPWFGNTPGGMGNLLVIFPADAVSWLWICAPTIQSLNRK